MFVSLNEKASGDLWTKRCSLSPSLCCTEGLRELWLHLWPCVLYVFHMGNHQLPHRCLSDVWIPPETPSLHSFPVFPTTSVTFWNNLTSHPSHSVIGQLCGREKVFELSALFFHTLCNYVCHFSCGGETNAAEVVNRIMIQENESWCLWMLRSIR